MTSVLTNPGWLDLECALMPPRDRLTVTSADTDVSLDEDTAGRAAQRLAETLALHVWLTDSPLYRLVDIEPGNGAINGAAEVTRFIRYALTMDLLEGELVKRDRRRGVRVARLPTAPRPVLARRGSRARPAGTSLRW